MHELGHVAEHTLDHDRFGSAMLEPMADPTNSNSTDSATLAGASTTPRG